MKTKGKDVVLCVLFCGFLAGMLSLFLLLPEQSFSQKEKRYLKTSPELTADTLLSGSYGENVEGYLADHIPGRDFFVGVSAYYDLLSNRQVTKDVYVASGDRLVEAPVKWNAAQAEKNMQAINDFAEAAGRPVDLMIVPSAGFVMHDDVLGLTDPYTDDAQIAQLYAMAGEGVTCRDITGIFADHPARQDLYYRTDHHWTAIGAHTAYRAYMEMLGRPHAPKEDFSIEYYGGFLGSTYSRSGLWLTESENVELWRSDTALTVINSETEETHQGVFYEQRLEELDKYTVYLDGNHSLVRIDNPQKVGSGKLLVIRDSYANCLGTFLAESYESVVLVDLRYYKKPVTQLLTSEEFTDVLVCYSLGNFMTDSNVIWLR